MEDTICNGADDNASGSSVVLAVADAFRRSGLRPRRSIIFAHFAGEELGLLGSRALVEHDDGHFEIITWADHLQKPAAVPQVAARAA